MKRLNPSKGPSQFVGRLFPSPLLFYQAILRLLYEPLRIYFVWPCSLMDIVSYWRIGYINKRIGYINNQGVILWDWSPVVSVGNFGTRGIIGL